MQLFLMAYFSLLGNDNIFALTNQKMHSVRFDMKDVEQNKKYALYDKFWIDDEDHNYTLHILDYSGDAGTVDYRVLFLFFSVFFIHMLTKFHFLIQIICFTFASKMHLDIRFETFGKTLSYQIHLCAIEIDVCMYLFMMICIYFKRGFMCGKFNACNQ